jgi:hypothetical protein
MLLSGRRANGANGYADDTGRLSGKRTLTIGSGGVVDCVLEHTWDRTVIFWRDEQQTLRRGDLHLQPFDLRSLIGIIILIVEREVANLRMLENEVSRSKLRDCPGKLYVKRISAQATDKNRNVQISPLTERANDSDRPPTLSGRSDS